MLIRSWDGYWSTVIKHITYNFHRTSAPSLSWVTSDHLLPLWVFLRASGPPLYLATDDHVRASSLDLATAVSYRDSNPDGFCGSVRFFADCWLDRIQPDSRTLCGSKYLRSRSECISWASVSSSILIFQTATYHFLLFVWISPAFRLQAWFEQRETEWESLDKFWLQKKGWILLEGIEKGWRTRI